MLKMHSFFRLLAFVLLVVQLFSCSRKKWDTDPQSLILPQTEYGIISGILVDNQGILHLVGGDRLERNDFLESADNGVSWALQHFDQVQYSNKAAFCLTENKNKLYAGSFDGKIFWKNANSSSTWNLKETDSWWYSFTGLTFVPNGIGFAAGNWGYNKGLILKLDTDLKTIKTDSFPFAINDISFLNDSLGYAVGYGVVLKTMDAGLHWNQLNLSDDNYRSIYINNQNDIWTVGFNGTIAQITDNGEKSRKIKNGQSPFSSSNRFLDIAFKGQEGYIVGEKGTVLHSSDGGENWSMMKKFTKEDLYVVAFNPNGNWVYFGGNNNAAFKYTP